MRHWCVVFCCRVEYPPKRVCYPGASPLETAEGKDSSWDLTHHAHTIQSTEELDMRDIFYSLIFPARNKSNNTTKTLPVRHGPDEQNSRQPNLAAAHARTHAGTSQTEMRRLLPSLISLFPLTVITSPPRGSMIIKPIRKPGRHTKKKVQG